MAEGKMSLAGTIFSLVLALAAAFWIWKKSFTEEKDKITVLDFILVTMALLFCWRHFGWIHYRVGASVYTLDRNNLGDLPLHMGYMAYFLKGASFWPDQPYFALGKLHYP